MSWIVLQPFFRFWWVWAQALMLAVFILSTVLVIKRPIEFMWSSDGAQALLRHLVLFFVEVCGAVTVPKHSCATRLWHGLHLTSIWDAASKQVSQLVWFEKDHACRSLCIMCVRVICCESMIQMFSHAFVLCAVPNVVTAWRHCRSRTEFVIAYSCSW